MQLQDEFMPPHKVSGIFRDEYTGSIQGVNEQLQDSIRKLMQYRDNKIYLLFVEEPIKFFQIIWDKQVQGNPELEEEILPEMRRRFRNVYRDLFNNKLEIVEKSAMQPYDFQAEQKSQKINFLKEQSEQLKQKLEQINGNLNEPKRNEGDSSVSRMNMDTEKRKEWEETRKKYKQEQIDRDRKLRDLHKKIEEGLVKKESEIKKHEEQLHKEKIEEMTRKIKEQHDLRDKEKELRERRSSQYVNFRKAATVKPPLFRRLENDYNKRYLDVEVEERSRFLSERKSMFEHIDEMKLNEHEEFYEKIKQEQENKRKEKADVGLEQEKSRSKYHSSYELERVPDLKEESKQLAREKWQKVKQYKQLVKEKYKPKVDEIKRQELMNLIEDIDLGRKKLKKVKLENGNVVYEEVKPSDPRILGIEYLERVKEMAVKYKMSGKRKASVDLVQATKEKKSNYLEQMRNNRPKRSNLTSFIDRSNMSYEEKVKRIELEADKLTELTKQKEQKLKFGKFKTSEEILACKDQIDQNYMEIVRMKLRLISKQETSVELEIQS